MKDTASKPQTLSLEPEAGILSLEIQDMIEIQLLVYRKRSEKKQ